MIYEITNPSDKYTIASDDLMAVCVATAILGNGRYGLKDVEGMTVMPPFILLDCDTWFWDRFGCTFEDTYNKVDKTVLAEVLESVVIGNVKERELYDTAMTWIEDADGRAKFQAKWHDLRRSSMNDIGAAARHYATKLRDIAREERKREPTTHQPYMGPADNMDMIFP